ncbi:kinase-like domain-containing protein [Pseudomassariella vexata]|uniref:Kinase-like domain-containing protein n=1 Tax=Pseudomassariella vexata TaxID=1141098 RepID=A0A1Y2DUC3_9PEZI|nr:kinase-like domain-containing protein [Pseudomassariella vexata]ORY62235.1 kinase-like domain-containing protein [Pseudomassariella vexata]
MATASPTPIGSSHLSAPTRRPSLRSGLRRAPSRPQIDRALSNPPPSSAHASSKSQYNAANADSSDDEIPVPMKLSAITKALLNDNASESERNEHGSRVRTRAQSHRPSSPVPAVQEQEKSVKRRSILGNSTAEEKRTTRASSVQLSSRPTSPVKSQASRENSPVRKRVVRLSTTPGAAAAAATAAAQFRSSARRSTSLSASQRRTRPPSRESQGEDKANASEVKDVNTPVAQPARSVRIIVGSSGNRGRSSGSSGVSSRRVDSASHPPSESEAPEDPATAPRQRAPLNQGSVSRPGSNGSRSRAEENQVQSSMRVKRVGKIPGSFLSGPARRGRRRQSEEDGENEGEPQHSSQEQESQLPQDLLDMEPADNLVSSYYVPDRLASGSPVSAKSSARYMRESSVLDKAPGKISGQGSPERDEIPIPHYKIPPPRADMPSRHDQENEAPPPFKRNQEPLLEKDLAKIPSRPLNTDIAVRPASPERKALAPLSRNTPRRVAPPPPPKMSILDAATSAAGAATTQQASKKRNYMKLNGKYYTRLDTLGRGGSAKVYRVAADNGKMFALKRVAIENADELAIRGYRGEIDLLKKLNGCDRVINLFDYEMNEEKQVLSLLMEMGELDLNTLFRLRLSPEAAKFDSVFVRFYWKEMLECLAAVHAFDIVHSDLKPANFVLVQGRLKLIDFGIANAIQTDETVNVHRETQIGTPNYMSPESLIDSNTTAPDGRRLSTHPARLGTKLMKLGKPSDIWSLGCILFQMVYGTPPFGHIPNPMARCHAIIDWDYAITFRERGMGDVPVPPSLLRTMKRCLNRDQHLRPTCQELLSMEDPFLYPVEVPEGQLPVSEELLGRIIQSVVARCRERMPTEAEAISIWPGAYWGSVAKAVGKDVR